MRSILASTPLRVWREFGPRFAVSTGVKRIDSLNYSQVIHKSSMRSSQLGAKIHFVTKSLQSSRPQKLANLARFTGLLMTMAVVFATAGCASHRPAPLLVEHQLTALPANRSHGELSLKLVTYNIWGLPSWMTGAPKGRYPKIERELERLDPDIILLQEAWTAKARKAAP